MCCRSAAQFSASDVVDLLGVYDDIDDTIPSGSEDERLDSGDSDCENGAIEDSRDDSDHSAEEEGSDSNSEIDDEVSNHDNAASESEGNDVSTSDEKSASDDDRPPKSPQTKKRKTKSKKQKRKVWKWSNNDLDDPGELPENLFAPKGDVKDAKTEINFFLALFSEEAFELFTLESNRYKLQMNKNKIAPITQEEMRKFIGIVLYMSVVHLPGRRDYWSDAMRQKFIADAMPVNRFEEILSILHVNDNEIEAKRDQPGYDRLHKVHPLLKIVQKNIGNCAETEMHMSVDEQMVPFKGHHSLKVYMKNKPKKWGYKVWALAGQSGYLHKFYVSGDNLVPSRGEKLDPAIGKSGEVVLNLVSHLPKGTHIYFDNYFASPELLLELKNRGYHATCTVRANRRGKCPLKSKGVLKKEGRGAFDYKSSEGVVMASWFDNKVVTVASNKCSVLPAISVRRYSKQRKEHIDVQCPALVKAYNKSMGGVDHCDMLLSFYRIKMKSRKWYKRLIFHLIDLCCVNAWTKLYKFKLAVATSLVQGTSNPQSVLRTEFDKDVRSARFVQNDIRLDGVGHLPRRMADIPKRCKQPNCSRRTKFFCVKCKVYLCIDKHSDCFYDFHLTE